MTIGITYAAVPEADLVRVRSDERLAEALLGVGGRKPEARQVLWFASEWDGLWYLLSPERRAGREFDDGATDLLGHSVVGGDVLNPSYDFGYGPPRFLTSSEVLEVCAALGSITAEALRDCYAPQAMCRAKVYPQTWVRDGDQGFIRLVECFESLRAFYSGLIKEQLSVVIALG